MNAKGVVGLVMVVLALVGVWCSRRYANNHSSERGIAMFDELVYRDGSANTYRFHTDGDGVRFDYDPVTPERSSTGMYSGGEPRAGRLDAAQLATLWQHVSGLEANTALQVADRGKGTGLFEITTAGHARSFIVARRAELLAFDAFVAAL